MLISMDLFSTHREKDTFLGAQGDTGPWRWASTLVVLVSCVGNIVPVTHFRGGGRHSLA